MKKGLARTRKIWPDRTFSVQGKFKDTYASCDTLKETQCCRVPHGAAREEQIRCATRKGDGTNRYLRSE